MDIESDNQTEATAIGVEIETQSEATKEETSTEKPFYTEGTSSNASSDENKPKKPSKKVLAIAIAIALIAAALAACFLIFSPSTKYNNAVKLLESKDYTAAIATFSEIPDYRDSSEKIKECRFKQFVAYLGDKGGVTVQINSSLPTSVTIAAYGTDAISLTLSATNSISNVKLTQSYSAPIRYGDTNVTVSGKTALSMGYLQNGGTYTNELVLNAATYTQKSGLSLSWQKHSFVGNREDLVESFNDPTLVIPDMIKSLNKTVSESGLGLTMKDLGFSSYQE